MEFHYIKHDMLLKNIKKFISKCSEEWGLFCFELYTCDRMQVMAIIKWKIASIFKFEF